MNHINILNALAEKPDFMAHYEGYSFTPENIEQAGKYINAIKGRMKYDKEHILDAAASITVADYNGPDDHFHHARKYRLFQSIKSQVDSESAPVNRIVQLMSHKQGSQLLNELKDYQGENPAAVIELLSSYDNELTHDIYVLKRNFNVDNDLQIAEKKAMSDSITPRVKEAKISYKNAVELIASLDERDKLMKANATLTA